MFHDIPGLYQKTVATRTHLVSEAIMATSLGKVRYQQGEQPTLPCPALIPSSDTLIP